MAAGGKLEGRVAIVTGAARGQGAAEARRLAAEGARVVLGDVLDEDGGVVAAQIGDDVAVYRHLDVTSEADWRAAVETAAGRFGGLHVLVSNAGISPMPRPIADTPVEQYRKVIEVNQIGMFTGIHTCAPVIADSCTEGPSGSIVLVSSVNGFVGAGGIAGYVSSKFAVRGLAKVAALELGRRNVRVNSVHPGPIDTAMIQPESWGGFDMRPILAKNSPLGRVGTPDDVAELVCFLASDASAYCTGSEFVVDGGYLAGPFDALGVDG